MKFRLPLFVFQVRLLERHVFDIYGTIIYVYICARSDAGFLVAKKETERRNNHPFLMILTI